MQAEREAVWHALHEPDVLHRCLPGCLALDRVGDDCYRLSLAAKVGPVRAYFAGTLTETAADPPRHYTLAGEGKAGAAGFATGTADVSLEDDGNGGTRLVYHAEAQVGGRLAQVGMRVVEAAAVRMADAFLTQLSASLSGEPMETNTRSAALPRPESALPTPEERGLPPLAWAGGLIVAVGLILMLAR